MMERYKMIKLQDKYKRKVIRGSDCHHDGRDYDHDDHEEEEVNE